MKPEPKLYLYTSRSDVDTIRMAVDIWSESYESARSKLSFRRSEPTNGMQDRRVARHDLDIKNDRESIRSIDDRFANICRRGNEYHREP